MKFRMILSALLLAAGIVFVGGCSKSPSPSDVAKKFCEAMKKNDFATAAKYCDGQQKEAIERMGKHLTEMKEIVAKGSNESNKDEIASLKEEIASMEKSNSEMKYEIKGEKIEGDAATVTIAFTYANGKTEEEKVHCKKVNGEWKLTGDK
jgi:PBP1b-binding outer membrane lipoprotein LpoB